MKAALWHRYKVFMHKKFIISAKEYIPPRKSTSRKDRWLWISNRWSEEFWKRRCFVVTIITISCRKYWYVHSLLSPSPVGNIGMFFLCCHHLLYKILVCSSFVVTICCRKYLYVPSLSSSSPVENIGMFLLCCHRLR